MGLTSVFQELFETFKPSIKDPVDTGPIYIVRDQPDAFTVEIKWRKLARGTKRPADDTAQTTLWKARAPRCIKRMRVSDDVNATVGPSGRPTTFTPPTHMSGSTQTETSPVCTQTTQTETSPVCTQTTQTETSPVCMQTTQTETLPSLITTATQTESTTPSTVKHTKPGTRAMGEPTVSQTMKVLAKKWKKMQAKRMKALRKKRTVQTSNRINPLGNGVYNKKQAHRFQDVPDIDLRRTRHNSQHSDRHEDEFYNHAPRNDDYRNVRASMDLYDRRSDTDYCTEHDDDWKSTYEGKDYNRRPQNDDHHCEQADVYSVRSDGTHYRGASYYNSVTYYLKTAGKEDIRDIEENLDYYIARSLAEQEEWKRNSNNDSHYDTRGNHRSLLFEERRFVNYGNRR